VHAIALHRGSVKVLCSLSRVVAGSRLDLPTYVRPTSSVRDLPGVPVVVRRRQPSRLTVLVAIIRERVGGLALWALVLGHSATGPHVVVTSARTSGRANHRDRPLAPEE
jgi:hypothetical protein